MFTGPKIVTEGLVFGFDTGYPEILGNHKTNRFNKGEPTTTFNIGSMLPTDPTTTFTSNNTYHSNMHGTAWDWTYYPNSNISSDGGMEWHPNVKGPTFTGAWLMKKRAGGNSESNFSGIAPSTITNSAAYTVSVWVKTDQASCFRIHLNTTKNGSSYWGYASSYHSGGNEWERLSLTIPANSGNTSINVIRFQAVGTTVNADAYCRDYQVEQRSHATPFILGGTRSVSGSLIDLTRTTDIDVSNMSFDSNAQMNFDGTDDKIVTPASSVLGTFSDWSIGAWIKYETSGYSGWMIVVDQTTYANYSKNIMVWLSSDATNKKIAMYDGSWQYSTSTIPVSTWTHIAATTEGNTAKMYINGNLDVTRTFNWSNTSDVTEYMGIGGHEDNPNYRFNGNISTVKVYDKVLTAEEVSQNYKSIRDRFNI